MTKNQSPSPATRRQVFDVDLDYEIVRVVEAYGLLLNRHVYYSKLPLDIAEAVDDGLFVAFCTHARNLLEFFYRKPDHDSYYYAVATDYAKTGYEKLDRTRLDVDWLYKQLCAQINHLTYSRTDKEEEKIGPQQRKELINIILAEATRLAPQLKSDYEKQHLRINRLTEAATATTKAPATKAPTTKAPAAKTAASTGLKAAADRRFLLTEPEFVNSTAPSDVGATIVTLLRNK
jgi:hypothetical protein